MDFITDLLRSGGCTNMIIVTDRLSKGVMAEGLKSIMAKAVADWFLRSYYLNHSLPQAIVSDRGVQFMGSFWAQICQKLGVTRRLSTTYLLETNSSTKHMNQELENFLRKYVLF